MAPKLFRIRSEEDFDRIPFENGMAAVEVPAHLIDKIEMRDFDRGDSARLTQIERSIRANGFRPVDPIQIRIGRKGRWVVVDGGHRMTAARHVMAEFWTNLFGQKVKTFYFVLFLTPDSWGKVTPPDGVDIPVNDPKGQSESQESWDRASKRKHVSDV